MVGLVIDVNATKNEEERLCYYTHFNRAAICGSLVAGADDDVTIDAAAVALIT